MYTTANRDSIVPTLAEHKTSYHELAELSTNERVVSIHSASASPRLPRKMSETAENGLSSQEWVFEEHPSIAALAAGCKIHRGGRMEIHPPRPQLGLFCFRISYAQHLSRLRSGYGKPDTFFRPTNRPKRRKLALLNRSWPGRVC